MRLIDWIEDNVPGLLLGAMTVIVVIDVLGRYVLNFSFAGSAELATAMFVWLVFLGSACAARKLQHVAIDGVTGRIPAAWKAPLQVAIHAAIIAISAYMVVVSTRLSFASWNREIDVLGVSYFFIYIIIPISFLLMGWHSAGHIAKTLRHWNNPDAVKAGHANQIGTLE